MNDSSVAMLWMIW